MYGKIICLKCSKMRFNPSTFQSMKQFKDNRIKWWNLSKNYNDSGTTPRNYALRNLVRTKYVTYLDDDNYIEDNHIESMMNLIEGNSYVFSSFYMNEYRIICREPKLYRIDTSSILHRTKLLKKYGYWKPTSMASAHDWDLVSRWKNEPWAATLLPTLHYKADLNRCRPLLIYKQYGDQEPLE